MHNTIRIQPQAELDINCKACEAFKHIINGIAIPPPLNYTTDDIVNLFRHEGYVKGYSDCLKTVLPRLTQITHDEAVLNFINQYITFEKTEQTTE